MELKLYHTTNSKLQTLPVVGGQLIVSRDNNTLCIDIDDIGRIEITDFIDIETDAQRLATLAPLPNKYYYVADTNSVWRFVGGEWKKINNNTTYTLSSGLTNGTVKLVGSDGTETEVTVKGLGSAAFTDANDYAKKDNALLLEEQTLTEFQKSQVKTNLGIPESIQEVEMMFHKYNTSLSWNEGETVYTETWTYNGKNYRQVLTEVSDTQFTKQLYVNDVLVGTWTLTVNESGMVAHTVYTA